MALSCVAGPGRERMHLFKKRLHFLAYLFWGLPFWVLGLGVLGFRVLGLGFGVSGSGP